MTGTIAGIVNVVSYGYHESRVDRNVATIGGKASHEYLEKKRAEEIETLSEWMELLADNSVVGWLITVVTKADLWWDQRDKVLEYYSEGPYANRALV